VSEQGLLDQFFFLRSQSHTNTLYKFQEHFLNTINSCMCCLKCSWRKSNKQGIVTFSFTRSEAVQLYL